MGAMVYNWAIEQNLLLLSRDVTVRIGGVIFLRIVVDGWEKVGSLGWYVYCVSTIYADRAHQVGGSDKAAIQYLMML